MKLKVLKLFVIMSALWLPAIAQDNVNKKFGKPTKEEMQMTVYQQDPNAEAVILCRLTNVEYTIQPNGYVVDYHEKFRVKVLKPEGARFANVTIPYSKIEENKSGINATRISLKASSIDIGTNKFKTNFGAGTNSPISYFDDAGGSMTENAMGVYTDESVEDLKATAFNMENGKVVKSKLKNSDVVKEQIDEQNWQVKFTVPNVKEGTVIEYEYTLHSQLFWRLHDWFAQCEIPVAYACLDMEIPNYLIFNIEEHGIQRLACTCTVGSMQYKIESDPLAKPITVNTNRYTCVGRNLIAMPKDQYVWNVNDYCAGITAELKTFSLRGTMSMPYAKTWDQIDAMLLDDDDLGKQLNNHSPLSDELSSVKDITNEQDRAEAICKMVFNKVKWNGKYFLWPEKTSETLKKGEGNNADINMLLIQTLRDAGLKADPVVLRQRDEGQMPYNFPTISKLSTYVVAIKYSNGMTSYVDASSAGGCLDALPEVLLVDKARLVAKGNRSPWVNLQKVSKSQIATIIDATLDVNGKLSGKQVTMYKGLAALKYRQQKGITNEFSSEAKEEVEFTKQGEVSDGKISINPFNTTPMEDNPFTAEKRLLPVEFSSEGSYQVVVNLMLPEGYALDGEGWQTIASTPDKGLSGRLITTSTDDMVQVKYQFNTNKVSHPEKNYDTLRGMFDMFSKKCKEDLVFKKQ